MNTTDLEFNTIKLSLPAQLDVRAARVSDDPAQYSLAAFASEDALLICKVIRADMQRDRRECIAVDVPTTRWHLT